MQAVNLKLLGQLRLGMVYGINLMLMQLMKLDFLPSLEAGEGVEVSVILIGEACGGHQQNTLLIWLIIFL